MKKFSFKFLTAFIAVVVTIMSLPMNVLAAELQNSINQTVIEHESLATETSENNTDEQKKQIVEVTDLRTESTKTFRLPDGSYYLAQYSNDIHSLDENGEWRDIDNTLFEMGNEIGTNDAKIKFAKKTNGREKLFTLHDGNKKLTLSLNGAAKGVLGQVKNNEDVFPKDATELQKMTTLSKISASVLYENILANTDLEYVISGSNIKENIIVKAPHDSYEYSFTSIV